MGFLDWVRGESRQPVCASCGERLSGPEPPFGSETVVVGPGASKATSGEHDLYKGAACFSCQAVFCVACLGDSLSVCPKCGGSTTPATVQVVRALGG